MKTRSQRGFSLVELLVAVSILIWVFAVVFTYVKTAQERYSNETTRADMVQESRQFMDQIARDLHMVGYPGRRMFGLTPAGLNILPPGSGQPAGAAGTNWYDDDRVSAGIVRLSATAIQFEGDIDGNGSVEVVVYQLVPDFPTDAPVSCPCRLQRGVITKNSPIAAGALPGALNHPLPGAFYQEAQGIINSGNTRVIGGATITGPATSVANNIFFAAYRAEPVFRAFDDDGAPVPLPIDITTLDPTGKPWAFRVRNIRVTLNVLGPEPDLQTKVQPVITMSSTAKINNRLP
ncbi:MAG: type II secretion system GspH family protein [Acidobacteriales bacterium]|nr:type II secretion system GspH family protein [Terriglobales bacterium]